MSGTSLDGIDVAIVQISGSGRGLGCELLASASLPFEKSLRDMLSHCADSTTFDVDTLCRLNARLALEYAGAVRAAVDATQIDLKSLTLVGCHGQTVRHHPEPTVFAGEEVASTLQLGNGGVLSAELGIPVVWDFRSADLALGGQGAPLVPYVDYVMLSSEVENRVALNLGGIANLTALAAGGALDDVLAFDTGPANMLIDSICRRLYGLPFDESGRLASEGEVSRDLVTEFLERPFFQRAPPKSAGRRTGGGGDFGEVFATQFLEAASGMQANDILASATMLTVVSISRAIDRWVPFTPDRILVSGGGAFNEFLIRELQSQSGVVSSTAESGLNPHYKEAMAFAVLAHETANGVATSLPNVTGASRAAILGAISWP